MSICYIIGAMPDENICIKDGYIIAADKGMKTLVAMGKTADLILGDFDSLGYVPRGNNVETHPSEKDDTDTMLALRRGMEKGYQTFVIYGGMGGRFDHTLANLQTLLFAAKRGAHAYLVGGGTVCTAIYNETLILDKTLSGYFSVFAAFGDAHGVTLQGLKYEIQNHTLSADFPLGVSNECVGKDISVSVADGALLMVWNEKPSDLLRRLEEME